MPLYVGFAATGVGVALPGATLPAMLERWHLNDAQGGRLFLLAWIGSSLGALLVHGSLRRTLRVGSLATALASLGLAYGSGSALAAYAWMALYGTGLGLTMTTTSLIREAASGARSGAELIRLNFIWAVGACACPALAAHALARGDLRPLLTGFAMVFAALAAWTFVDGTLAAHRVGEAGMRALRSRFSSWGALRRVPLPLILMTMLITGVEASAGAWLATYARRGGDTLAEVVAAPTCLWAGLLLSRLLWSTWDGVATAHATVRGSALLMAAAAALLLGGASGWPILLGAFLLGFGIGPVYPLLLAWTLRFGRSGAIFFLAGVGSACLPWLTGVVSSNNGSLRTGLLVPLAGACVLAGLAWVSPLPRWTAVESEGV